MRGVIIEGVTGSGKTAILRMLRERLSSEEGFQSQIFLSELETDRVFEEQRRSGGLDPKRVLRHSEQLIHGVELLNVSVIFERLLLSHLAHSESTDFYPLDVVRRQFSRLGQLGFIQIVLVIPEDEFAERVLSTTQYRGECWTEFLISKGKNQAEIVAYFKNWQERLLRNAEAHQDVIQTIFLPVKNKFSPSGYQPYCDEIYSLMNRVSARKEVLCSM